VKPEYFMQMMCDNQGCIAFLNGKGLDPDGLERRNPVIVALGDSVTAGHFESLAESGEEMQRRVREGLPVEITDTRESYLEKFRQLLIEKYEYTSVSAINAGIAGDHLRSMSARLYRDVICYQPDLVLINGSLNWNSELGTTAEYKAILRDMVREIKAQCNCDIVLLTPNGDLPNFLFPGSEHTTPERVQVIRELAEEEQVCLADVYAVWEQAGKQGCPWKELLANGINHPSAEGHEVYAQVLMKLFE
jgi:lysophospholipase L1-like esterase